MTEVTGRRAVAVARRFASVLFLGVLLAACGDGGDSSPPPVSLTAVAITGMPVEPLAPMQTAQLTARATYSDGSVKDVTTTATWSTSNVAVLTVSATGTVTATGPGEAEVIASIGGVSGRVGMKVAALPAAFFIDGVEYGFEYQLDAQGRVDSYRTFQRPGLAYENPPDKDGFVIECSGSFRVTYSCSRSVSGFAYSMRGEAGRLAGVSRPYLSMAYFYEGARLARVYYNVIGVTPAWGGNGEFTLAYDELGRLRECNLRYIEVVFHQVQQYGSISTIASDAGGRLSHAEYADYREWPPDATRVWSPSTQSDWSYGPDGWMTAGLTIVAPHERVSTWYSSDSDGWLLSRGLSGSNDTFSFIRGPSGVSEESFTRAEPSVFYAGLTGRIRYERGRFPSEPTFVPRALTGLNGADYFGIISSHHR